jgi:hypothetical protein
MKSIPVARLLRRQLRVTRGMDRRVRQLQADQECRDLAEAYRRAIHAGLDALLAPPSPAPSAGPR